MTSIPLESTYARARLLLRTLAAPPVGGGMAARVARGLARLDPADAPGTGEPVPAVGEIARLQALKVELLGEDGYGGVVGDVIAKVGPPEGGAP